MPGSPAWNSCAVVPGTIGGALKMNAGCYGSEVKDVFVEAVAIDDCLGRRQYDRRSNDKRQEKLEICDVEGVGRNRHEDIVGV